MMKRKPIGKCVFCKEDVMDLHATDKNPNSAVLVQVVYAGRENGRVIRRPGKVVVYHSTCGMP